MLPYIILGVLLGLPLLLGMVFRVATTHLFVALLSGELLERYFRDDAEVLLSTFGASKAVRPYIGLIILVLPIVLTSIFLHHSLTKGKVFLHFLPLAFTGVIFAAFSIPLLPEELSNQLNSTHYGRLLQDSTELIIGAMLVLQLLSLWLFHRQDKHHKKKH